MEKIFSKTLITNLLGNTLFKKNYLKKQDYTFNKEFIKEHSDYLSGKTQNNVCLQLEIVSTIFNFDEEGYVNFRKFIINDLALFEKTLKKNNTNYTDSPAKTIELIDTLLRHAIKEGVIQGLLIFFLEDKVKNLEDITMFDINNHSISKQKFESLVESFLDLNITQSS